MLAWLLNLDFAASGVVVADVTGGWLRQRERDWLRRLGQPPALVARVQELVSEVEAITGAESPSVHVRTAFAVAETDEEGFLATLETLAEELEAEHQRLAQDVRTLVARLRDEEMQAVLLMTAMLLV